MKLVTSLSRSKKHICSGCYVVCSEELYLIVYLGGFVSMKFHVQFFYAIFVSMRFLSQGLTMLLLWDVVVFALQLLHVQRLA